MAGSTDILLMTLYFGLFGAIVIFAVSFMLKGFFWKYIKVRTSMGKLKLVKIKGLSRTYYSVGRLEEYALIFKDEFSKNKNDEKRLMLSDDSAFYNSLSVSWIDIDGLNWSVIKPTGEKVTTHDPEKENDLYLRALYKPSISSSRDNIMLILMIFSIILLAVVIYLEITNGNALNTIAKFLADKLATATVTPVKASI